MCLLSASEARVEGRTLDMDGNAFTIIPNFENSKPYLTTHFSLCVPAVLK